MALSDDERRTLIRLQAQLDVRTRGWVDSDGQAHLGYRTLKRYFRGSQLLVQLGLAVPAELRQFVTIANWPRIVVRSAEERMDLRGFRLPGDATADKELWRIWQANNLYRESQLGHLDAFKLGRAFVCVGTGDDPATPLVTLESAVEMAAEWDPRRRRLSAAGKFYTDSSAGDPVRRATLYLPNRTEWLVWDGEWKTDPELNPDEHGLGRLPVEQLTIDADLEDRSGFSHMLDAISLTDAAARALTIAQVATEVMGIPQRYVAGMSQTDFTDPETGETLTAWESYLGRILATVNQKRSSGSSRGGLTNSRTSSHVRAVVVGGYGLPLRYMGQATTNPPSAMVSARTRPIGEDL